MINSKKTQDEEYDETFIYRNLSGAKTAHKKLAQ